MDPALQSFRLRDLQKFHERLDQIKSFDRDLLRNVAFLTGELGELVRAIQNVRRPTDPAHKEQARRQIADELADLLAYVIKLANYAEVDLEEAYRRKMEINLNREWPEVVDGD